MLKKIFNKINIIMIILIIILTINFMTNFLSNDNISRYTFNDFQYDSEELVLNKINYDNNKDNDSSCKYGLCMKNINDHNQTMYIDYPSQVGLQGYIISFLHNTLNIPIKAIYIVLSFLLAAILTTISYFISKKYDNLLGIIFYITFFLSPWIIAFARNLYWVSFTWFLPMLLGIMLSVNYNKRKIIVPLIYLSILIKCLCGYEYITTIMLSTIIFFIIDLFIEKDKKQKRRIFKTIIIVGIACMLAFATALCIHGYMRGNGNVVEGIKTIYKKDVLRRTIITVDKDNYTGLVRESIESNIFDVLKIYYFHWSTDIIYGIGNIWFSSIAFVSLIICLLNIFMQKKNSKRNLMLYIMFLLSTLSWFILGKSHSYIHGHMNFVLWYFGYVQICLYMITEFIKENFIKKILVKKFDKKKA